MEWIEITGKTVDEAREKAVSLLGVADDDAQVEVLAEAKMGLFGRVREEARVRARVVPTVPRSKEDSNRKRRSASRTPQDEVSTARSAQPERAPSATPTAPAGRQARGRVSVALADDQPKMEGTMSEELPEVPVVEQAAVAKEFIEGLLTIMGVDGATTAVVTLDEDTAEVQVTGGDLGLLIGPKGATLLALQDLARTVVQRRTGARTGRLLLDVAGYRHKRKDALERFTQKVADDVVASGSAVALEPMSSADRKIVHDAVNAISGVTTTSEGEDPRRHVVVHPA